jgi:DNA-binding NarL/FixJ family response regulator
MPITVLLADDHVILREGLRGILASHEDFLVVAEAGDGLEAVSLAGTHHPNVAVVDIGMAGMNGIDATAHILSRSPETAVLILTVHNNEQYVLRAVKAGAHGYLLKSCLEEEEFVEAIRELSRGQRFFSPLISALVPEDARHSGSI